MSAILSKLKINLLAAILLLLMLIAGLAATKIRAAPGDPDAPFSITMWAAANGGGSSQGGPYVLVGTSGEPGAGYLAGDVYILRSGFWHGLSQHQTYMPLIRR